jgi:acid stress-induced BolA-like protein IbaG/YrbA
LGSSVDSGYTARPETSAQLTRYSLIMNPLEIAQLIEAGFDDAKVKVESDDNTHFGALVVATEFEGKRPLARHQLIYKTLGSLVGNEIHALSITALTPDEWRQQNGEV